MNREPERPSDVAGRLDAIYERLPVGVGLVDSQGRTRWLNRAGLEIHGFASLEEMLTSLEEYQHEFELRDADGELIPQKDWPIARAIRGEYVHDFEVRLRRQGWAHDRTILYSAVPARDSADDVLFVLHDLTERKQIESQLHSTRTLMEGIASGTEDLIAAEDSEFRYLYFNEAYRKEFRRLWGRDIEIGTSMVEALAPWPEDQAKARDLWGRALQGETFSIVTEFGPTTAEQQVYELGFHPVRDEQGQMIGAVHRVRNVTERVRMHEALQASEARYRALVESQSEMLCRFRPEGTVLFANRAYAEARGVPQESLIGSNLWEYVAPDDHAAVRALLDQLTPDAPVVRIENRVVTEAGERWTLWTNQALAFDEQGRLTEAQSLGIDITDRKRAELALRESEERFRNMADHAPVMVWVTGPDHQCEYLSQSWYDFTGQTPATGLGMGWLDAVHPEHRGLSERIFLQAHVQGKPFRLEYRLRRRDGEYRWAIDSAQPRFGADGQFLGYIGSVFDITERKAMEVALREADQRKDDFLATLAHELRNPLAPIRNSLEMLRLSDQIDMKQQALKIMDRQLSQLVHLVDDLLDLSRITRGKIQLRREQLDLTTVIESALEATEPLIRAAGHELTVVMPQSPALVDGDATRLAQVFANLLSNAAKYTEPGGHVWLSAETHDRQVSVSVRDTGIGIAPDHLPHLFEMFSQVAPALERSQGGLGIGLSLVRGLVSLHGGTVEAHSAGVGRGSEFVVRLPLVQASAAAFGGDEPVRRGAGGSSLRILVADDNRDSAETLAVLLRLGGHEVRTAHDGVEAVQAAAAFRPQLVLLDIGMPKLNGYEAAEEIRQTNWGRDVCLVAMTGWGQEEDKRRAFDAGFDQHLTKPVEMGVLEQVLARLNAAG